MGLTLEDVYTEKLSGSEEGWYAVSILSTDTGSGMVSGSYHVHS